MTVNTATTMARLRAFFRQALFQLHWFAGLVAGTLLIIVGITGATLVFEDDWLNLLNPGVRTLSVRNDAPLTPAALIAALPPLPRGQRIGLIIFPTQPGQSIQIQPESRKGGPKAEPWYADPYTGAWLGQAKGQTFFETVERLHRFMLLPREQGRLVTGTLASSLFFLLLSGIYLRLPREALKPSAWLKINFRLSGRPFLWALHAVLASWALPVLLLLSATGIYWSFDGLRSSVDAWAGVQRAPRMKREAPAREEAPLGTPDLTIPWQAFTAQNPQWTGLRIRMPARADADIDIQWLLPGAGHERQRNRMLITPDGRIKKDERFADQGIGKRTLATIYPLHMGRYFGRPGQIANMLSALVLALLGISGWLLYLKRHRQKNEIRRQRTLQSGPVPTHSAPPVLIAWASQTGRAESLALRTASALQQAGHSVQVSALAALTPAALTQHPYALFVVSTFGEGQAPDAARGFANELAHTGEDLSALRFGILALGNRQYAHFCGFGKTLQIRLAELGAKECFPITLACDTQTEAYQTWFEHLSQFGVTPATLPRASEHTATWSSWKLVERHLLNSGSQGLPLFELSLVPRENAALPAWEAGALVEIEPRHDDKSIVVWLHAHHFDPAQIVESPTHKRISLQDLLASSTLPESVAPGNLSALLASLKPLAGRRYSIASIHEDGSIQLIVRQHQHAMQLGLASGFLTEHCPLGGSLRLRLQANPAFLLPTENRPCIFIGNGSGMAGLRGLLRERIRRGHYQNWMVFGERNQLSDQLCAAEIQRWEDAGQARVDRVYSRDPDGLYVQDHLQARADQLKDWVAKGAALYVCGSLQGMAGSVDALLRTLLGHDTLTQMAARGLYRRDVY